MTTNQRSTRQFYAGLVVLLCALLMIIVRITGWVYYEEKLQLGVAVVFLSLGTVLVATSQLHRSNKQDKTS